MPVPQSFTALPTQPIGSIPRPLELIQAMAAQAQGQVTAAELEALYTAATKDTILRFEATGSPVISDGEQRKFQNFATYCVHGSANFAPDGFRLQFVDHYRQWPRLTQGPFRYARYADRFVAEALAMTHLPVKQAVISPSALSLFYPADDLPGYSRDQFLKDLLAEHEHEVRACLRKGAHLVQIDFAEGRLAHKLDPTGRLLDNFIQLNNLALNNFSASDLQRIGVHTCPGADRDSTHSRDVDYAELLPSLFELRAGNFFIALAGEPDRLRVLRSIRDLIKPEQRVFIGVIDPLNGQVESPEQVRDRILEAAEYIPVHQLGSTDDCGFSPFCDDVSTTRELAFAKIQARVEGNALASAVLQRRLRTELPSGP